MTAETAAVPVILVTNDDGIHSVGLQILREAVAALGQVVVIAPDREQSATGHAMTLHAPLRVERIRPDWYAVSGTPTDCVNLGLHGLLPCAPALVVSGINKGCNLADDITYSGTVAAAMEATLMGVPALAISQDLLHDDQKASYTCMMRYIRLLVQKVLAEGLPADTFLNVNFPALPPLGLRLTRQGKRIYDKQIIEKKDPRGRPYYWLGGEPPGFERQQDCDCGAVADGYASVTPLHLDLTNYHSLSAIRHWTQDFPAEQDCH
ncbi:5'/3'-nucleotidase SurE [Desulfuromonas thiophila]|uniref:5'/3'-nucleotidase SurE n=1 Tax=Desulfuromonas thiophila TaxID=57664 RepID=UPI0024A81234|nr:5'/3'-nucleotidase SurE [Desulfuromonas thiophila]